MEDAYDYDSLIKRAKMQMPVCDSDGERFRVPEIDIMHQGRITIIRNFSEMANVMHREKEHLMRFLLKEIGTSGEVTDTRAIFQGNVSDRQINDKMCVYLNIYVICEVCGRPDTELIKENKATFMKCHACGAINPVKAKK